MEELIRPRNRKFGPYICIKLLGAGGQSAVYSAMHESTGRMVALRAMTISAKDLDAALRDCKQVLEDIVHLDSPNLVAIENYGSDGATLYIAMNVMYGGTLHQRMRKRGLLDPEEGTQPLFPSSSEILSMTERIAFALDDLHSKGIVHGQISPSSIMFDGQGKAHLADVGFTKLMKIIFRLDATNSFNMTRYSAPELWDGERPSPATDQYAFACAIYELLTGKAPFDAPSIFGLMQAHANNVVSPPHYIRPGLSHDLAMVFWQALAKPTNKRYPTVMKFYETLAKTLGTKGGDATGFFTFPLH